MIQKRELDRVFSTTKVKEISEIKLDTTPINTLYAQVWFISNSNSPTKKKSIKSIIPDTWN